MAHERRLTRRRVLAGLASGAAALSLPGCGRSRRIEGGFVAPAVEAGHALRGGPQPPSPDARPGASPAPAREHAEVVVVGGGVAGLCAAWRLLHGGIDDVRVLELEPRLGGTAASDRLGDLPCPLGAHYVPLPTREQVAVARLLLEAGVLTGFDAMGRGVPSEDARCRAPQERVFHEGAWHEGLFPHAAATAEDEAQWARFSAETAALAARRDAQGRRAFALPTRQSARDDDLLALDRLSMAQWLAERGYDAPLVRWEVAYACRDDFGADPALVSAWAGLHYFASRIAVPGDEAAPFLTWPEGNGRLVHHLARRLGARVRTGARVHEVEAVGEGAVVRWRDLEAGTAHETAARRVVLALPSFVAGHVFSGADRTGFPTSPWLVANLHLDATPTSRGFPVCWDNVLLHGPSLGYVVATHQLDRAATDTVWTWYLPFPGPDTGAARRLLLEAPWSHWRDAVLRDLSPAHDDLARHVRRIHVVRWAHGMVRPVPGQLFGPARERALEPVGPVVRASADLAGLPLFEEAADQGVRAAETVLAALRPDEAPWQ